MEQHILDKDFFNSLPKKRVAAAVLFRNSEGKILVLHKDYGDKSWNLPGGVVEAGEGVIAGAIREIKEEIGIDKTELFFMAVDYKSSPVETFYESIQFLFSGGVMTEEDIEKIKLSDEHSEFRFLPDNEAFGLLSQRLALRLKNAIKYGSPVYMEDGIIMNNIK